MTGISVRGGSNGIEAHYDDMTALARLFGAAATSTFEHAAHLHGFLAAPDVVSAALLDPYGAAQFSGALLDALDGPAGLSWLATEYGGKDAELRAAAITYERVDRLAGEVGPALTGLRDLPSAAQAAAAHLAFRENFGHTLDQAITSDPDLLDTLLVWPESVHYLMHLVAMTSDGRPKVTSRGTDRSPIATTPPRTLKDVMAELAHRYPAHVGGDVDIRFVYSAGSNGRPVRHVIVDIPGAMTFNPSHVHDATGPTADLRSVSGASTSYSNGVLEAMKQAGIKPGEPILLVGHSLGGLVAASIARTAARTGRFNVTNVVTAGSPIARIPIPRSVQVLALENQGDIVPQCDGADNPDRTNETTVTLHRNVHDVLHNHDLDDSYVPGAGDVDESDDPSVRSYLSGLNGFLTGTSTRTEVYHVERVP